MSQQSRGGQMSPATSEEGPRRIRLLIVDDHATVVAGLSSIIGMQPDMEVVGEAFDGQEAVEKWRQLRADVTLLDFRMPRLDAIGVLDAMRELDPSARAIVLSTFDGETEIARAVKAGAKAYLLKDIRKEELLDCIRRVNAGECCIPENLIKKLIDGISSESLTGRELEVVELLAKGKNNRGIAEALLLSELTVKGHMRSIFDKLHVVSRAEAIGEAARRGIIHL